MATSGSDNFTLTRDEIIREAYELLGLYSASDTLEAEDVTTAARTLNLMIKSWHSDGVFIWKETEGVVFLNGQDRVYTLSNSLGSGDHGADTYVQTALTSTLAVGATTLSVESTVGMTAGDYLGFETDNGRVHWTTITSVTDSTTLEATTGSTFNPCASGNPVYTYTTRIGKPLFITSARLRDSNYMDVALTEYPREDYLNLINKYAEGEVNGYYYQPSVNSTSIYVYFVPSNSKKILHINYFKVFDDFDNATDTADFPAEWLECITFNLAKRLAMKTGKDSKLQIDIGPIADELYQRLKEWSHDHTFISINPGTSR